MGQLTVVRDDDRAPSRNLDVIWVERVLGHPNLGSAASPNGGLFGRRRGRRRLSGRALIVVIVASFAGDHPERAECQQRGRRCDANP